MKAEEARQKLKQMSAEDLRLVAAQLYKMLPKKLAEEKGADRLLCDPQGFLKSAKAARLPELPDVDMLELETREFLENAREQRYFAPNRIISKSERGRWRFVARRLYKDWSVLAAAQPENLAAAKALEDLYRLLCRGCEIYLFPSTDTFRAIGVSQSEFLDQVLLLKTLLCPRNEWIAQSLSLVKIGAYGDTTRIQLHEVFLRTLKTSELKEVALDVISSQLDKRPMESSGDAWEKRANQSDHRRDLLCAWDFRPPGPWGKNKELCNGCKAALERKTMRDTSCCNSCWKQKITKSGCANMRPFGSSNPPSLRIGRRLLNRHSIRASFQGGAFEATTGLVATVTG